MKSATIKQKKPSRAVRFAAEEHESHFWICDGKQRVLLFVKQPDGVWVCNSVFLRQPDVTRVEFSEPFKSEVAIGAQLLISWRWPADWLPMERTDLNLTDEIAAVTFTRRSRGGKNEQTLVLTLRRDGETGYLLHGKTTMLATYTGAVEFLNFLPARVHNSWADKKRFRATLHEVSPGVFERRPHSHLNVLQRHFWADDPNFRKPHVPEPPVRDIYDPSLRKLGSAAPFAISHAHKPLCPGGMVFMEGETVTPAVRVLKTSAPVLLSTCDAMFDEHIVLERGVPQPDGRCMYEAEYEIFRLPQLEVEKAVAKSVDIELSQWVKENDFAPFFCERVNTFDNPASHEHEGATGVFFAFENPRHLVSWQRTAGPNWTGAMVLNTRDPVEPLSGQHYQVARYNLRDTPWIEAFPLGFLLDIVPGMTAEFSAQIRTEGDARAWAELREAIWGHFQRDTAAVRPGKREDVPLRAAAIAPPGGRSVQTQAVTSSIWTPVSDRMTATIPDGLSMIFLVMEGRGRAFFSELLVKRA